MSTNRSKQGCFPNNVEQAKRAAQARAFFGTVRGQYIVGQSLAIAARVMRAADHPWKEESNAMDCELLGEIFQPFYSMEAESKRPILGEGGAV
jgi:hypothetical protein